MTQVHVAVAYLFTVMIAGVALKLFKRFFGSRGLFEKAGLAVVFLGAVYLSLCLAIYGLDHGFRSGQMGASVRQTNQYLHLAWVWIRAAGRELT